MFRPVENYYQKMRPPAAKRKKKIYIFNIIASQRNGKTRSIHGTCVSENLQDGNCNMMPTSLYVLTSHPTKMPLGKTWEGLCNTNCCLTIWCLLKIGLVNMKSSSYCWTEALITPHSEGWWELFFHNCWGGIFLPMIHRKVCGLIMAVSNFQSSLVSWLLKYSTALLQYHS